MSGHNPIESVDNDNMGNHDPGNSGGGGLYPSLPSFGNNHGGFGNILPGSGNHWTDGNRSRYGNYMLWNRQRYNVAYGTGAREKTQAMMSIPFLRDLFLTGKISLSKVSLKYSVTVNPNKYNGSIHYGKTKDGKVIIVGGETAGGKKYFRAGGNYTEFWTFFVPYVVLDNAQGKAGGGELADDRFSNSEKATLGLAATGGSVQVATELINRLSGTVKNADVVNFGKSVTKKFGFVGVGLTTYNAFSDGTFTTGDGARILLSGATFIPYVGWAYGAVDIGVLMVTGTSVTDRVGVFVDDHWGLGPIRP